MYEKYAEIRDKMGFTDAYVSKNTGIPASTFTDWKVGRSKPKLEKLIKLARLFECKVEDFIPEELS